MDLRSTHFILTRFNVRGRYYRGDPGDEWLRRRLELFARYTLPSFRAQSVRDFRWLVLIDSESPHWFRAKLAELSLGSYEVVEVEGAFDALAAGRIVRERLATPFVLTTRVDNDDAVARDFVETIQRAAVSPEQRFINLVDGAQLGPKGVYQRPYTQNPFITLVEGARNQLPATVFVKRHFEASKYAPVLNLRSSHPMWLQVVHGGNVLTELVGLRMKARRLTPWFGCEIPCGDGPFEFALDFTLGAARIAGRLVGGPHRLVELGRALAARPAQRL
ncbi:hypothetical protein LK10_17610 [Sinomonas humi]|uniref:Rhamnosyl transferase n=1 Tax=Sinomonas humi TaxID=1338436 RepID=A0A0B2AHJ6_9MICC|nr:hypothetical protein LK10_17610 [Sinomonas humi]